MNFDSVFVLLFVISSKIFVHTRRGTHLGRLLLGLEEKDCVTLEACVPPTPGTNGDVLFFAI